MMRLQWLMLATMVAAVWAIPSTPISKEGLTKALEATSEGGRNNILETLLLNLLDSLRETIEHGTDDIPPLDPLHIPSVDLNDEILPLPGAKVLLQDVEVLNLATFAVDQISVTLTSLLLQRYRLLLDIRIPTLAASAEHYEIDISALGYSIYGAGDLKVRLIDPKISANLLFRLRLRDGGMFIELEETEVKFSIGGFEPEINGLFGHQGASDFVNLFLKDFVPSVADFYEAEITEFLSTNVHQIAGAFLDEFDITDLIG